MCYGRSRNEAVRIYDKHDSIHNHSPSIFSCANGRSCYIDNVLEGIGYISRTYSVLSDADNEKTFFRTNADEYLIVDEKDRSVISASSKNLFVTGADIYSFDDLKPWDGEAHWIPENTFRVCVHIIFKG